MQNGLVYMTDINQGLLVARYHGPHLDVFVTPVWFAAVVIAFSTFIGLATGIYPSYRASKLNPLEALRYK